MTLKSNGCSDLNVVVADADVDAVVVDDVVVVMTMNEDSVSLVAAAVVVDRSC